MIPELASTKAASIRVVLDGIGYPDSPYLAEILDMIAAEDELYVMTLLPASRGSSIHPA